MIKRTLEVYQNMKDYVKRHSAETVMALSALTLVGAITLATVYHDKWIRVNPNPNANRECKQVFYGVKICETANDVTEPNKATK